LILCQHGVPANDPGDQIARFTLRAPFSTKPAS